MHLRLERQQHHMFAKIFSQILDSSLAENYQHRHVFEDLLKLCDINGVVDVTHEAIARRTNVPLEIVKAAIAELEKPDARSRNPDHAGARIVRLDAHRDWGWLIVNYHHYRTIASEEQRREKTLQRVQRHRDNLKRTVTPVNASNAMQMERERKYDKASGPTKASKLSAWQKELADRIEAALGVQWENDGGKWIDRIKSPKTTDKCERVIAEVESAIKESRIATTPAQYAEDTWGRFA
jgi:hypothetical protein